MMVLLQKKAWVVAASMGYGHERATWPLRNIAEKGKVLSVDSYPGMPSSDALLWKEIRSFYEVMSRCTKFPVIGDFVFSLFDKFQAIKEFYPRELGIESPTLQLRQTYGLIKGRAWGKHLIKLLSKKPLPFVTSFAPVAQMAEYWKYPGPIFLIVTDSDISRSWASLDARKTRILYCASTERAKERLQSYGVPEKNIRVTGFPLPEESLGKSMNKALRRRVSLLDPSQEYQTKYHALLNQYLGSLTSKSLEVKLPKKKPVAISFAIGGAGAQDDIARILIKSLHALLQKGTVRLLIILGTHQELQNKLPRAKGVVFESFATREAYFRAFPRIMEETDILWTKPSELVFYAALGIPLLLSSPIGSQEVQNRKWLHNIGAGIDQLDPKLCCQWLPDLIASSRLAEAAMQGFVEMEKYGTKNIIEFIQARSADFPRALPASTAGPSRLRKNLPSSLLHS